MLQVRSRGDGLRPERMTDGTMTGLEVQSRLQDASGGAGIEDITCLRDLLTSSKEAILATGIDKLRAQDRSAILAEFQERLKSRGISAQEEEARMFANCFHPSLG